MPPSTDRADRSGSFDSFGPPPVPTPGAARDFGVRAVLGALGLPAQPVRCGRYELLDKIGEGAMGVVYRARDPELGRLVALKLLHDEGDGVRHDRLRQEARALARLSDPHVVTVFAVGLDERAHTWIAMELVSGTTLEQWAQDHPPGDAGRNRDALAKLVAAGRGLAAAHAAGLVHRDFKPSNVLVGDDDAPDLVKVADFGLARFAMHAETGGDTGRGDSPDGDTSARSATGRTSVAGTPRYMSPEQRRGEPADARSDQFSFCVAAWRVLSGRDPFGQTKDAKAMLAAIEGGAIEDAPELDARVRATLRRGMAARPEDRFGSMDELLSGLAPRRPRRWLAVGALAVVGTLAAAVAWPDGGAGPGCDAAPAQLADVWDDARREATRTALQSADPAGGATTWAAVAPRLDAYAEAWTDKYREVCEATLVQHTQSDAVMDRRMACLQQRRGALGQVASTLAAADARVASRAQALVAGLPSLTRCDEVDALEATVPPPDDAEVAAEVAALRARLAAVRAWLVVDDHDVALAESEPVLRRAETLGYAPLLAEALVLHGHALTREDEAQAARPELERAYELAVEHGHDAIAAEAAARLTTDRALDQPTCDQWAEIAVALASRPTVDVAVEAETLDTVGRALVDRAERDRGRANIERGLALRQEHFGPDALATAKSLTNLAVAQLLQGQYPAARATAERALAVFEANVGTEHHLLSSTLNLLGAIAKAEERYDGSIAYYERAISTFESAWGPDHPRVADMLHNMSRTLAERGRLEEALQLAERSLDTLERNFGSDHVRLIHSLGSVATTLRRLRRPEEALAYAQRALAILEANRPPGHLDLADPLHSMASAYWELDDIPTALAYYQRALEIYEQNLRPDHPDLVPPLANIGMMQLVSRDFDASTRTFERALQIAEKAYGAGAPDTGHILTALADIAHERGDDQAARPWAERALKALEGAEGHAFELARARFLLAQILWDGFGEHARARDLADAAQKIFAGYGERFYAKRQPILDWLDAHPLP